MLDAHADEAFGDGNGVFGDELLEGNEKASLDGNAAGDCGMSGRRQYKVQGGVWSTHKMEPLLVRRKPTM